LRLLKMDGPIAGRLSRPHHDIREYARNGRPLPYSVAPAGFRLCLSQNRHGSGAAMAFYIFYVIAITILVLHFTGWLKRHNLEWIVYVLAITTFPAVIYLR
jgi:hypothetical protein